MQANFSPRIDPSAEDRWTAAEEPLAWAHSRIASYNPAQRLFKCADCECVGFLARVAEHWLGTHSQARAFTCPLAGCGFASGWARGVRSHLARDHHSDPAAADHLLRDNPALDDLTRYLQRLKNKVSASSILAPSRPLALLTLLTHCPRRWKPCATSGGRARATRAWWRRRAARAPAPRSPASGTCAAPARTPPTGATCSRATRTSTATRSHSTATYARSSSIEPIMSKNTSCACTVTSHMT